MFFPFMVAVLCIAVDWMQPKRDTSMAVVCVNDILASWFCIIY